MDHVMIAIAAHYCLYIGCHINMGLHLPKMISMHQRPRFWFIADPDDEPIFFIAL